MSFFKTFRNFVSPSKKLNLSSKPPKTSSATNQRSNRETPPSKTRISPTKDGLKTPPLTPEGSVKKIKLSDGLGVKGSRVAKSVASPKSRSTPNTSAKSLSKFWNLLPSIISKQEDPEDQIVQSTEDFEGSTLVDDSSPSRQGDTTLIGENKESSKDNVSPIDNRAIRLVPEAIEDGQAYKGWSEDEVWLYEKIDNRGYEPLLPKAWDLDFPTLFDDLFSEDDSKAFINTVSGRKYHGKLSSI